MANYFVINRPSNLVTHVMTSSYSPADTKLLKFIVASDKALTTYYKWCKRNPGLHPDVGELMMKSPYFKEKVCNGKTGQANPRTYRVRDVPTEKHLDREEQVKIWIAQNPEAHEYDLDAALYTGIVAARAYLSKYNP
ncbi:hypothetical protein [Pseudomonas]|nr:hypothetical protein [Pseudomonas]